VVVRLLVLKHARNWSYVVLEREVRANLVYRKFTRIGMANMADAKTMGKWGVALGPEAVSEASPAFMSGRLLQASLLGSDLTHADTQRGNKDPRTGRFGQNGRTVKSRRVLFARIP
jgi:hypothetical protein